MWQWRRGAPLAAAVAATLMWSIALSGQATETVATKQKAAKPDGVAVNVTPEMIGAGIVSSGVALPAIPPVTGTRDRPVASWGKPLPYPIVIVDYETRQITWTFGASDTKGSKPGYFNYPDDAHLLADGTVVTADIRNCRIQFIDPATSKITAQWGKEGTCRHDPPRFLAYPNGSTPLDNGDILVTEIPDARITQMTRDGRVVWSTRAPGIRYPSDAFPTRDGQIIVADYSKPGRIVIFNPKTGKATWQYAVASGEKMLDHPSLALELPTGDVVVNDDARHRVLVIDRTTKEIVWQYGVTDTPGHAPGYLFYPDGMDIDMFRDWKAALPGR